MHLPRISEWNNERLSIWNGSFASVSMSIVNGFVAMYLLDALHASDVDMGLLNSLPSLVNLFAMTAAAVAIRYARSKKRFCAVSTGISRSFYVWMALIPWLPLPHAAQWVIWLTALTRVPQSFSDLSWQALIGDIIPPDRRSEFFSDRNRMMTLVGLAATMAAGLFLQQFDKHAVLPYQCVFMSTAVFAALEVYVLCLHEEPTIPAAEASPEYVPLTVRIRSAWRNIAGERAFWIGAAVMLWFNFGWQMAWPLFNIYQIQTARAPAFWLGMFTIANQAAQIVSYRWWGRMAERFGNLPMLAVAAVGMAVSPAFTVMSTNLWYLVVLNLFMGIPVAGTTLLLFNYLLDISPTEQRTAFIAYYNVGLAVIGFLAPECGVWALHHLGMNGAMWVSSVLRLLGAIAFAAAAWWLKGHPTSRGSAPGNSL